MTQSKCRRFPHKLVYPTKAKARKSMRRMSTPKAGRIVPFPCGDHYHIGRKNATKRSLPKIDVENWLGG